MTEKKADCLRTTFTLNSCSLQTCDCSSTETFEKKLRHLNRHLKKDTITTVQVNVGTLCNQSCIHCHVNGSPDSECIMPLSVMEDVIELLKNNQGLKLDITGGAPELHPNIKHFIVKCSSHVCSISLRSNLTALLDSWELIEIFRDFNVELICSLPDISHQKTDYQRGKGVFEKSIRALRLLNESGYGHEFMLHLVHNPTGFVLPEIQEIIEKKYRNYLKEEYGITFNKLFILNNMPIGRFKLLLEKHNSFNHYLNMLHSNFNAATADGLMCRYMLNIGWDGKLYDCDFNNALGLPVILPNSPVKEARCDFENKIALSSLNLDSLTGNCIVTGDHCYGCTSLRGSGCYGNVLKD